MFTGDKTTFVANKHQYKYKERNRAGNTKYTAANPPNNTKPIHYILRNELASTIRMDVIFFAKSIQKKKEWHYV